MIEKMPKLAMGSWEVTDPQVIEKTIEAGYKNGVKGILTAQIYGNELPIGNALKKLKIDRADYWINSIVWVGNYKYHTYKSVEKSLERLQTTYIDAMFMHAMVNDEVNIIAYKELMRAREDGLVRNIGVANFSIPALKAIKEATGEYPKYHEIVSSVKHSNRPELEAFLKENNIEVVGYSAVRPYFKPSPLVSHNELSSDERAIVDKVSAKHNVSPAIVLLGWSLAQGDYLVPKLENPEQAAEVHEVLDLKLDDEDMKELNSISKYSDAAWNEDIKAFANRVSSMATEEAQKMGKAI